MRKTIAVCLVFAILLCLTASALAGPLVTVDNHNLQPNTPGQTIQLTVSGIDANSVAGMVFAVEINDGGPAYGGAPGPLLTGIDVDAGPSIWVSPNSAGHNPPNTFLDGAQFGSSDFLTTSGFVLVNGGVFVTLTIDTTGFGPGVHQLQLIGNQIDDAIASNVGSTDFIYGPGVFVSSITDGTITIIPEPSSVVLGLFAVAGLGAVAIRRRRARQA